MKTCSKCGVEKDASGHSDCYCKPCRKAYRRAYYIANREKACGQSRTYREDNKDKVSEQKRRWRGKNRVEIAEYNSKYYAANRSDVIMQKVGYQRLRRKEDKAFLFREALRSHSKRALKGYGKNTKTERLLGMAFEDFFALWEARCEAAGLTVADAVIDHIVPLAAAKTKAEAELMSHWSNLQPLTAEENTLKSDNMTPAIERRYNEIRGVAWLLDALQGD